jgi:hypothetical protein
MKKWTQHEPRPGNSASPDSINDEFRAHQSSFATLDRSQLPPLSIDSSRLTSHALHQVWCYPRYPLTADYEGEQDALLDTSIPLTNEWVSISYQDMPGGWLNVGDPITLTGFKGGNLFVEWSGNGWVFPLFTNTKHSYRPGNPKRIRLRLVVGGIVIADRWGPGYTEHWRIFGTTQLPAGNHALYMQFQLTPQGPDDAIEDSTGQRLAQGHVFSSKVFVMARYR